MTQHEYVTALLPSHQPFRTPACPDVHGLGLSHFGMFRNCSPKFNTGVGHCASGETPVHRRKAVAPAAFGCFESAMRGEEHLSGSSLYSGMAGSGWEGLGVPMNSK
jgi:hypothetical protein